MYYGALQRRVPVAGTCCAHSKVGRLRFGSRTDHNGSGNDTLPGRIPTRFYNCTRLGRLAFCTGLCELEISSTYMRRRVGAAPMYAIEGISTLGIPTGGRWGAGQG
eukprot:286451-Rhodomonas_salina.5